MKLASEARRNVSDAQRFCSSAFWGAPPARRLPLRRALRLLVACCALLLLLPPRARAAQVVLVVADRLERADLWEYPGPNLARLRREAASGLICTRFMLSSLPESAYVALGAGSWVQYEGSVRWRGGGDLEDAAAFWVATGRPLPRGALYCRERERLSLYSNPEARPGALGEALRNAGKRTACIGNADLPRWPRRQLLALLMDTRGVVSMGDVGPGTLAVAPDAPGGVCVDVPATVAAFERVAKRADVVAIEFGDTSRLAACQDEMLPEAAAAARAAALARLDTLVGALRARIDPGQTTFILLSPAPPVAPSATEQVLTPLFIVGTGWGHGLLRSATTRRPGLVANADLPVTLAGLLGAGALPGATGAPLSVVPEPDPGAYLRWMDERTRRVARLRFRVFRSWAVLIGPAVFLGPLLLGLRAVRRRAPAWAEAAVRGVQICALSLPAGALLVSGFAADTLGEYLLRLAVGVGVVAASAGSLGRVVPRVRPPAWIAALTLCVLIGDITQGSWRILGGMVSYALTEGARFYGIGNEMFGIALGLALVGMATLQPLLGPRAPAMTALLGAILTVTFGYSGLGANFGGGLTAAFTLAVAAGVMAGWRGARLIAAPALALVAAAAAIVCLDLLRPLEAMSHVGRAALQAQVGGMPWLTALIARKAHMNEVLIGRTSATRLFFMALPVLLAVSQRPPTPVRAVAIQLRPLLLAGVTGSVAAFLLNDSGIIAGGLMLAFVTVGAGYLALSDEPAPEGKSSACASLR